MNLQKRGNIWPKASGVLKMRIGYCRVSTVNQSDNLQAQKEALEKYNIEKWFIDDGKSGFNTNRQGFNDMLTYCRNTDELYIYDFSRLNRTLLELLETIEYLNNKNVRLISIHENIDTGTPTGKMQVAIIGAVSEFLSNLQKEKIREGIEVAKREGKYKGRKKKDIKNFEEKLALYNSRQIKSKSELAKELGVSRQKLYQLLAEVN